MAAIFAKEDFELKKTGSSTTVPNNDVCKVSYYLNCIDVGCGLNLIKDKKLLDYKNAHLLSRERQDTIFQLGWHLYDHENVLGKVIFLEPKLLPSGKTNQFYELKNVTSVLGVVASEALIAGQQTQVHKIMVCNMDWLTKYYQDPLNRNKFRALKGNSGLAGLLAMSTLTESLNNDGGHCNHCKGLEGGNCACKYGCPRKTSTKCTIIVEPDKHCSHCNGLNGPCRCVHGCVAKSESQCKVVHRGVICGGCHSADIEGPRYMCTVCDYDLCGDCYRKGKHNNTHAFQRKARVGSRCVMLEPRKKETAPSTPPHIPTAEAIPVTPETTPGGRRTFTEGMTVRLTGLTKKEFNGLYAVVAHILSGGIVAVHIVAKDKKMKVKEENLEVAYSPIPIGELVELTGLLSSQENGKLGQIKGCNASSGRLEVQILGEEGRGLKSFKPENLVVVEDANEDAAGDEYLT